MCEWIIWNRLLRWKRNEIFVQEEAKEKVVHVFCSLRSPKVQHDNPRLGFPVLKHKHHVHTPISYHCIQHVQHTWKSLLRSNTALDRSPDMKTPGPGLSA